MARSGYHSGDMLVVRLMEELDEARERRVLVDANGSLSCRTYRKDELGAYLESITINEAPWRLPLIPKLEPSILVLGVVSPS